MTTPSTAPADELDGYYKQQDQDSPAVTQRSEGLLCNQCDRLPALPDDANSYCRECARKADAPAAQAETIAMTTTQNDWQPNNAGGCPCTVSNRRCAYHQLVQPDGTLDESRRLPEPVAALVCEEPEPPRRSEQAPGGQAREQE